MKEVYHNHTGVVEEDELQRAFWLYFFLWGGNGTEWQDIGLPPPTFLMHAGNFLFTGRGVFIGWAIDGYFATKKGREYLNDTIARFILTFADYAPERLAYRPELGRSAHIVPHIYRLRDISTPLVSLYWSNERGWSKQAQHTNTIDQVFWAIKYHIEHLIGQYGEGTPVPYETLEDWAFRTFEIGSDVKDRSTLRAKCRSVWNWYNDRNWTIPKGRVFEMTRSERARANAQLKAIRARKKVEEAIEALTFLGERISVRKVAQYAGVSINTSQKYLKELQQQQRPSDKKEAQK